MRKLTEYKQSVTDHLKINLLCPKCNEPLFIKEASFLCQNKHCYDMSAKGYTNLCLSNKASHYSKNLFVNRRVISEQHFFAPLEKAIADLIRDKKKKTNAILDAGCGEGSHLTHLKELLSPSLCDCAVGIDIAPDSIALAAKNKEIFWFVADIGALPFANESFDFVLDILSPAHYKEFSRVLKKDGFLIKVVPGIHYLQELRAFFFEGTQKEAYDNELTRKHFYTSFPNTIESTIFYRYPIELENREAFLSSIAQMTPLTQNSNKKALDSFIQSDIKSITVELVILIGACDNAC